MPTPLPVATIGQQDFSPLGGKRSQVIGPGMSQLDMGFSKQIRVGARRQVEFRAEAFNVTNTPAFSQPGSLNFLDARNFASISEHAQCAASNANGHQVILVRPCRRCLVLLALVCTTLARADTTAAQSAPSPDSHTFNAQYALAVSYLKKGDVKSAIPHLRRAHAIDPAHYDNGYNFAVALLQIGSIDEARGIVTPLLKVKETGELHNLLGDVEERAGNLNSAAASTFNEPPTWMRPRNTCSIGEISICGVARATMP